LGDDFKVECPTGSGQMLTLTSGSCPKFVLKEMDFLEENWPRILFNGVLNRTGWVDSNGTSGKLICREGGVSMEADLGKYLMERA